EVAVEPGDPKLVLVDRQHLANTLANKEVVFAHRDRGDVESHGDFGVRASFGWLTRRTSRLPSPCLPPDAGRGRRAASVRSGQLWRRYEPCDRDRDLVAARGDVDSTDLRPMTAVVTCDHEHDLVGRKLTQGFIRGLDR